MRKTVFVVLVALAVIAAAACQNSPTGPKLPAQATTTVSTKSNVADLVGTWQATKVEAWNASIPDSRRDLVAQGGTVTLVIEPNSQALGLGIPDGKYTITVTMPGTKPGVDTGFLYYWSHSESPQIDFYPNSLPPDYEYGEVPAFLVSLSGNTMKLWEGGGAFLPFDFGWNAPPGKNRTELNLEFTRK
jgi:ABC-type glycerol-3-phosphate transport system substrate-binding protein